MLSRARRCVGTLVALASLTGALATGTGCSTVASSGGPKTLTYTEDAKKAYEEAMQSFRSKDWESARPLFEEVKKKFSQSRYARLAELRLADIEFAQEKYTDAISQYRSFVTTYRTDREVEYARYKLAKALYFDISDTFLQPPAEERDQATTLDAHRELRAFVRAFPRSRYRKDVDYMLEVVLGRLARHELYVARYYRKRENYDAAIARIDYVLKTYPNSGLDPEALVLKGETLMMMNRRKEAKLIFELVVKDWGGPFGQDAKAFLEELKNPSQDPPDIKRPADPGPPAPKPDPKKTTPAAPAPPAAPKKP
ncbi:MAG: tetratricopeptide repeat protein [Polyangiaceae bacterium]|nr:tetratricopeptide repeat protein [Polyangiaceae bacterium]